MNTTTSIFANNLHKFLNIFEHMKTIYLNILSQPSGITIQFNLFNNIKQMPQIVSQLGQNRIKSGQIVSQFRKNCPNYINELKRIVSSVVSSSENGSSIYRLSFMRIFANYPLYAYASKTRLYANAYGVA